jgi:hypothetical protein
MSARKSPCRRFPATVLAFTLLVGAHVGAWGQPVTLDVAFKLTDLEYHPLANVPVRLVFGSDADWQGPKAGNRIVTDAKGEARLTANVTLDKRLRKYPTNFWTTLGSLPQTTDHLAVGAELDFADFHWLYVVDLFRFPNTDTMSDGVSVYTADAKGRFVDKADYDGKAWKMRDLKGLVLTHPGYDIGDFMLAPDPTDSSGKHWTLKLAFRKAPPPVRW